MISARADGRKGKYDCADNAASTGNAQIGPIRQIGLIFQWTCVSIERIVLAGYAMGYLAVGADW